MNAIEKKPGTAPTSETEAASGPASLVAASGLLSPAEMLALTDRFKQALARGEDTPTSSRGEGETARVDGKPWAWSPDLNEVREQTVFAAPATVAPPSTVPPNSTSLPMTPGPAQFHGTKPELDQESLVPLALTTPTQPAAQPKLVGFEEMESKFTFDPTDDPTLGAAVLQSFLQQGAPSVAPAIATSSTVAAPRVASLESVVAETVSRVLVSDPLHDGRREVRIELARDVLPDTQVRLWREGGRLHVEFTAPPAVADRGLQDALPRLGDAIQHRTAETSAPVVTLRGHEFGASGQQGDQRSRQQYRSQEEIEEIA